MKPLQELRACSPDMAETDGIEPTAAALRSTFQFLEALERNFHAVPLVEIEPRSIAVADGGFRLGWKSVHVALQIEVTCEGNYTTIVSSRVPEDESVVEATNVFLFDALGAVGRVLER